MTPRYPGLVFQQAQSQSRHSQSAHSSLSVEQSELRAPVEFIHPRNPLPPPSASIGFHYFTYIISLQRAIKWYHTDYKFHLIILSYLNIPLIHHITIISSCFHNIIYKVLYYYAPYNNIIYYSIQQGLTGLWGTWLEFWNILLPELADPIII